MPFLLDSVKQRDGVNRRSGSARGGGMQIKSASSRARNDAVPVQGGGPWTGGRNGGQMRKSSLDQEKQEKKGGKVVTMPDKTGGVENQAVGGAGAGGGNKAPRKGGKKKVLDSETQEELHKGAKKALRRAVEAEVRKEKEKIAEVLVSKVKDGDMRGAVMVLSLMEHGDKEDKDVKKKRGGLKLIDLLESEPEWEGDEAETVAAGGGAGVSKLAS